VAVGGVGVGAAFDPNEKGEAAASPYLDTME
jgi:hypothetical protein